MTEKNSISDLVDKLRQHFDGKGITAGAIEDHLRQAGELMDPDQHVQAILSSEPVSYIKYGIYPNPNGEMSYYALPCSLVEDAFADPIQYESIKDDLISEKLEPHKLPMEYFETGLLRKFDFSENHWKPAQDDTPLVSSPSFKFVPRQKFFDLFYNDHALNVASKSIGQQEDTSPEPPQV